MALRPNPGRAPSVQAPARPGAGGATIPRTSRTRSAAAAAPIVAAMPPRRPSTEPAAPAPHPIKKSPTEAYEEARPFHSTIATIAGLPAHPVAQSGVSMPLRMAASVRYETVTSSTIAAVWVRPNSSVPRTVMRCVPRPTASGSVACHRCVETTGCTHGFLVAALRA